jgi:ubiquinone/menaquinone biosynthesis C-methylase UbiE
MPASPTATPEQIRDANTRYFDVAAPDYDAKWGISFGQLGRDQVRAKMHKTLGAWPERPFGDALEVGAGTGYLGLNLLQEGLIERLTATDISAGMLESLAGTAAELGLEVTTVRAEAAELPFPDESFDLVFGHAVLHHLPDVDRAFGEFARVLRPGGTIAFCGEPSRTGDRLAAVPKRGALLVAPLWRRLLGASPHDGSSEEHRHDHALESEVDVHAFSPADLAAGLARAGFRQVRIRGEELVANLYGWALRTLESTADPDEIPYRWRVFALRSYLALQRADEVVLEPRLPPELFYNLVVSARSPEGECVAGDPPLEPQGQRVVAGAGELDQPIEPVP